MKAGGKLCALLVLVFVVACAAASVKVRAICPDGEKACQVGENEYVCVPEDANCPEPVAAAGVRKPICPDGKKACQVGEDEYDCIDPEDECP